MLEAEKNIQISNRWLESGTKWTYI